MDICEMALKSTSFILYLDCVKLFFVVCFFSELFNGELFHQLSVSTFIFFVKNIHRKAINLMLCLILPLAKVPWWFLGVQFSWEKFKIETATETYVYCFSKQFCSNMCFSCVFFSKLQEGNMLVIPNVQIILLVHLPKHYSYNCKGILGS